MATEEEQFISLKNEVNHLESPHLEESDIETCVLSGVFSRLFIYIWRKFV